MFSHTYQVNNAFHEQEKAFQTKDIQRPTKIGHIVQASRIKTSMFSFYPVQVNQDVHAEIDFLLFCSLSDFVKIRRVLFKAKIDPFTECKRVWVRKMGEKKILEKNKPMQKRRQGCTWFRDLPEAHS
jgi:hypothetical protein